MAIAPQPQGGLGAMAPKPPMPDAPPANPAQAAQRISSLEQEVPAEEDFMERALRNKRAQEAALNSQIEALKNSLDSRMRPPFDPSLMAAASGFLRPTKTGGFGESAGYAAEAYASETDKEMLRKQAVDKAKLELAQKQAAMQSQNLMFEHQMQMAGYNPKELTTLATGPAGGAPSAGGAPAPSGGAPAAGGAPARAPREPRMITERDIQMAYAISPEYGKQVMDQAKFQQDDLMSTPQGPISKRTRQAVDVGLDTTIETSIPFVGVEKITQRQLTDIRALNTKYPAGDPQRADQFARYYASNGIGGTTYTPAVEGKPAESSMKTAAQREIEKTAETETQKARIKTSEERASTLIDRGIAADTTKQIAFDMSAYADSNPRVFQLMQTATLKDAILRSAEKMGAPLNIDPRIILQYKLTDKDIEALQMFAQKSAQLTVELRRSSRVPGEGATSESEGKLYSQVEALPSDTARVIGLKSELLALRTDYDKAAATLWVDWREQNPGKSFDKFRLGSDEFKTLRKSYDSTLEAVRKANTDLLRSAPPAAGAAPSTTPSTAPANETPLERLKRRKAELERQQGKP
jgi:hypothetical protein